MMYQFTLLDNKNFILEHKDFSDINEDKLIDYATSRIQRLKDGFKIEIKRYDNHSISKVKL